MTRTHGDRRDPNYRSILARFVDEDLCLGRARHVQSVVLGSPHDSVHAGHLPHREGAAFVDMTVPHRARRTEHLQNPQEGLGVRGQCKPAIEVAGTLTWRQDIFLPSLFVK